MQKILIAADYCPQQRVAEIIDSGEGMQVFSDVLPYVHESDYSIVNLEYSLAPLGSRAIRKCGPNLSGTPESIKLLRDVGFNMVTLANNHVYDYGDEGLEATIQCCENNELEYVGAGKNLERASETKYITIKNKVFAILNCCEHEFSIATDKHYGANPLNPVSQYYRIIEAKDKADYIIIIIHGGHEHYQLPSPRMQETYRFFIDAGADAVINHHQHCYSGYEVYKNKPIFYGLGNFCFDEGSKGKSAFWFEGYMLELIFNEGAIDFSLIPYEQCKDTPKVIIKDGLENRRFTEEIKQINDIINSAPSLTNKYLEYVNTKTRSFEIMLEPYVHPILSKMYCKNLLPSMFSLRKKIWLKNRIDCESHLDLFRIAMERIISQSK